MFFRTSTCVTGDTGVNQVSVIPTSGVFEDEITSFVGLEDNTCRGCFPVSFRGAFVSRLVTHLFNHRRIRSSIHYGMTRDCGLCV